MANYYDILKISTSASEKEICDALDEQYNYYRKLVTHHDSETAQKANQALIFIEKIRTTPLDSKNREIYDEAVGIKSTNFGGLADPLLSSLPNIPVADVPVNSSYRSVPAPKGVFECEKCGAQNPVGSRHCKKCGNQLSIACPNCGTLVDISSQYCNSCGINVRQALAEKRTQEEARAKQQEMDEMERLKRQKEFERSKLEQNEKLKTAQKKSTYRSCAISTGVILICMCLIYFGSSTFFNIFNLSSVGNLSATVSGNLAQTTTAKQQDEQTKATYAPQWIGNMIQIQAWLGAANDEIFTVNFEVTNLTQSDVIVAFITSDILVTDNFGKSYQLRYNTSPVRDTLTPDSQYTKIEDYSLDYVGALDPSVTSLTVNFPTINGEQALAITIPLRPIDDQLTVTLRPKYYSDDSFTIGMQVENNSVAPFAIRYRPSGILVSDDLGNVYMLGNYYQGVQYSYLINSKDEYSNSYDNDWKFTPTLSPREKTITLTAQIMGKIFSQVINLEYPRDQVRYEATLDYRSDNYFSVRFKAFNLGAADFLLRFNVLDVQVQTANGEVFSARDNQGSVTRVISSGNSQDVVIYYDGRLNTVAGLKLIFSVISAQENLHVDVQANNQ